MYIDLNYYIYLTDLNQTEKNLLHEFILVNENMNLLLNIINCILKNERVENYKDSLNTNLFIFIFKSNIKFKSHQDFKNVLVKLKLNIISLCKMVVSKL